MPSRLDGLSITPTPESEGTGCYGAVKLDQNQPARRARDDTRPSPLWWNRDHVGGAAIHAGRKHEVYSVRSPSGMCCWCTGTPAMVAM